MADAREVTYGIGFDTEDSLRELDAIASGLDSIEEAAGGVSGAADDLADRLYDIGGAGSDAARDVMDAFGDMTSSSDGFGASARDTFASVGAQADSLGEAFTRSMGTALREGRGLADSLQKGLSGALGNAQKRLTEFEKKFTTGMKGMTKTLQSPIDAIKKKLADAFLSSGKAANRLGAECEDAADAVEETGRRGEQSMDSLSRAISGAVKMIAGFAAIKAAASAVSDFIASAVDAHTRAEQTNAQFDALFSGTRADEWATDYAAAVNRSEEQVKSFMNSNMSMYLGIGVTKDKAVELSGITTALATDFATVFNMDDADALHLMQEAISGNTDALVAYGIQITEADEKEAARRLGLNTNIEKLSEAEQAEVRLEAILAATAETMGAATSKSNSLTNAQKDLNGVLDGLVANAGEKFAPAITAAIGGAVDAIGVIGPNIDSALDTVSGVLDRMAPMIGNVISEAGPGLLSAFENIVTGLAPMLEPVTELITGVIVPLAEIIGEIVAEVGPPLAEIFSAIVSAIRPLISPLQRIVQAFLPPLKTIMQALTPVIQTIGELLGPVGGFLASIAEGIGWVVNIVAGIGAKVWNFFTGLFGGAKDAADDMNNLAQSTEQAIETIENLEDLKPDMPVNTESFDAVADSLGDMEKDAKKSTNASREISNQNLGLIGIEATQVYGQMTLDAEDAWERMVTAAEEGALKIVKAFGDIATAALGVNSADINVKGVKIPENASGTNNFPGGWTRIHEQGGEIAFLPSGSAILPADKSAALANGAGQAPPVFAPQITIQMQGNSEQEAQEMHEQLKRTVWELFAEFQNRESARMAVQHSYA